MSTLIPSHRDESEDASVLWGWEQYFEELSTFVFSLGRGRIVYANESYTDYVLDCLSTCISTIGQLVDYIQSAMESVQLDDEFEAVDVLQSQLSQLLDCLREISVEWQAYYDQVQMNSGVINQRGGISFQVTTTRDTQGPGRPRFNITKEQLEYSSSMSFS